jgi:hypothetical protein
MIGFILIMLILIIFAGIVQTRLVPQIVKDVDMKTSNRLLREVSVLSDKLSNGEPITLRIEAPTYPKIPFLILPSSGSYRVFTEPMNMSINCTIILPNGSTFDYNKLFYNANRLNDTYNSSKRLWIITSYSSMPDDVYLFENTALLKITGGIYNYTNITINGNETIRGYIEVPERGWITVSHERLSTTPTINLIIFLGDVSFSGETPVTLSFIPVSYGGEFPARNINISFETAVPDYWRIQNESLWDVLHGEREFNVTDENRSIDDWINLSRLYNQSVKRLSKVNLTWFNASSGIIRIYAYRIVKGMEYSTSEIRYGHLKVNEPCYVFYTDNRNITVKNGTVFRLGVMVLDQYLNPARSGNFTVTVVNDTNLILINRNFNYTARADIEDDGIAYAYFKAQGSGNVTFNVTVFRYNTTTERWETEFSKRVFYNVNVT